MASSRIDENYRAARFWPAARTARENGGTAMNVKQLKELRKSQHEVMLPLKGKLDEQAYHQLNEYISSVVQLVKDTNNTTEERLLAENENLKRQLAEQEEQHRAELVRLRQDCSEELAKKLSGAEAKYRGRTEELEKKVTILQQLDTMVGKGMIQLNQIACTTKAIKSANHRFGNAAVKQMVHMAIFATAQSIVTEKDLKGSWEGFDILPYFTDDGWNVFICCKGELDAIPTVMMVDEYVLKRTLG
jgi:hypothetical protein